VIMQECDVSTESRRGRASDVVNGCKVIAVMWILIPINQGQGGLRCRGGAVEKGQEILAPTDTHSHTPVCTHVNIRQ